MTKATEEMLALADKIEYAIKTEGEITLFETNGTRVVYVLRSLAALSVPPGDQAREAVSLIDVRLTDLREANDVFRKSSWDQGRDIQRNDREIRWLIDLRTTLSLPSTDREGK